MKLASIRFTSGASLFSKALKRKVGIWLAGTYVLRQ